MRPHRIARVLKFVLFAALAATIAGAVVMSLWNALIPTIFTLRPITFWQALGLLVLSRLLFGRFGGAGRRMHWRRRMRERWEQMTPEERETLMAGMKGRCGPFESRAADRTA
jgi:hypothetical protein